MAAKKTWGIVGLGWLGQALAEDLKNQGHQIWGTHRTSFNFESDKFPPDSCDVLLLNTPPLKSMRPLDFARKISARLETRILFVSSTSVYAGNSGNVDESTLPVPAEGSGPWLLECESQLRARFQDRLTIIRPGGLIGDKRHPIFQLSGRESIAAGLDPVNLIHRLDLIKILKIASERSDLPLVNAVAPHHPLREIYYTEWAKRLGLKEPHFLKGVSKNRIVDSLSLPQIYPDWECRLLDFL